MENYVNKELLKEAAKQSGRGMVPTVYPTVSFEKALQQMKRDDACFFCYEKETRFDLKSYFCENINQNTRSVSFFVGPEGGISPEEAALAESEQIPSVSLGKRILRTETAPLCVLSGLMLFTDNLK